MYALKNRLKEQLETSLVDSIPFGFGVIFPDCQFHPAAALEWDDVMFLDSSGFRDDESLQTFLRDLFDYWREKHGTNTSVGLASLQQVKSVARPTFELVPNLNKRAEEIDARLEELTRDQYTYIDTIDANPRVLCSGGAGSGKTFLALETARRAGIRGHRVLIVCKNLALASFLNEKTRHAQIQAASIDQLGLEADAGEPVDLLIVDEGQDLLNFDSLDLLDRHLIGGVSNGNWVFFFDRNNQSGIYNLFEEEALNFLEQTHAVNVRLNRNCRNTHPIVLHTKLITGADLGTSSAGDGPKVDYQYHHTGKEAANSLSTQLALWLDDQVPPGDITVLSPKHWEDSCIRWLSTVEMDAIRVLQGDFGSDFPCSQITFCDVASFKGFENRFIALIDIESPESLGQGLSHMYVGMTRARAGLWMSINHSVKHHIQELTMSNLHVVESEPEAPHD